MKLIRNRFAWVLAALALLAPAARAQGDLGKLRAADFSDALRKEIARQRKETTAQAFKAADAVFVLDDLALARLTYDLKKHVIRWAPPPRVGVSTDEAVLALKPLAVFAIETWIGAGLFTEKHRDTGEIDLLLSVGERDIGKVAPGGTPPGGKPEVAPPPVRVGPDGTGPGTPRVTEPVPLVAGPWYYYDLCAPCGAPCGCGAPFWYGGYYPYYSYPFYYAGVRPLPVYVAQSIGPAPSAPSIALSSSVAWELRLPREDELTDDYPRDALTCYNLGRQAYLKRDYIAARAYLTHAVKLDDQDARFWYIKALAELALERQPLARASAQRGMDLQARGLPGAESIAAALQRVPQAGLQFLAGAAGAKSAAPAVVSQR
jgi:hypothetical protein